MKAILFAASLFAVGAPAMAIDINVNLGQPNYYGAIDPLNIGQPRVLFNNPVIIQRPANYINEAPIYLRVPQEQTKDWARYCATYNACGRRVLFVQDGWYTNTYAPKYRQQHDNGRHLGWEKQEKHGKKDKHDKHDRQDDDHDDDRGNGNGNGNGHGKGHGKG